MAITGYSAPSDFGFSAFHGSSHNNDDLFYHRKQRYPLNNHFNVSTATSHISNTSSTGTSPRHSPPTSALPISLEAQLLGYSRDPETQVSAHYLRHNCLLISHIGDNIDAEVDSHFTRSLSGGGGGGASGASGDGSSVCADQTIWSYWSGSQFQTKHQEAQLPRVSTNEAVETAAAAKLNMKDLSSYNFFYPGTRLWSNPYMAFPTPSSHSVSKTTARAEIHNTLPFEGHHHQQGAIGSYPPTAVMDTNTSQMTTPKSPYRNYRKKKDYSAHTSSQRPPGLAATVTHRPTMTAPDWMDNHRQNAIRTIAQQNETSAASRFYGAYGSLSECSTHYENPWSAAGATAALYRSQTHYPLASFGPHQASEFPDGYNDVLLGGIGGEGSNFWI